MITATHDKLVPMDLSPGWEFLRERASSKWIMGDESGPGAIVNLPHSWNCADTFQDGVEYYRGYGCYRRSFDLTPDSLQNSDTTWRIETERFFGTGELWINGIKISDLDGQYLGIAADVTPQLRAGTNLIAISLTNHCHPDVLPGTDTPDFVLHGGLAGRVLLRPRPSLMIDPGTVRVDASRPQAIRIQCELINESDRAREAVVRWQITDAAGSVLGMTTTSIHAAPGCHIAVDEACDLNAALERWSPGQPILYHATGTVTEDGQSLDTIELRFGSRSIEFGPHGFTLNGARFQLRGANRHESMPGFGNAIPRELHYHDARQLKEAGFNFVRLSHYPQHPDFLDACDEMGILVYAELASWKSVRTGRWLDNACRQLEQLIRRDRNRPSVILWGLGNEERVRGAYERLDALVKELDTSRPTIYAENHLRRAIRRKTTGLIDVWGCNYEFNLLPELGQHARSGAVVVSEAACYPLAERADLEHERIQIEMLEQDLDKVEDLAHVAGYAVWSLLDYATSRKGRYRFLSGLIDAWRVPKASYYYMQARNLDTPCLRIFGDWSEQGGSPPREILVVTNCERVILERDGAEVAELSGGMAMVASVEFQPGTLSAYGERGVDRIRTDLPSWGLAHRLRIERDESVHGEEIEVFRIIVRDAAGATCLDWNGSVQATVSGDAKVVTHTSDSTIPVRGGIGRMFVISSRAGEENSIRVEAAKMASADVIVRGGES